jgi:hypothetical protein
MGGQSEGEATKNLVSGKQVFCHAKNWTPFGLAQDRLRLRYASAQNDNTSI